MPGEKIVKSVFRTLNALHGQGFSTWVTKAYDLALVYDIDMNASVALTAKQFKSLCSERTKTVFVENWHTDLHDKPLLRSYRLYKNEFSNECYLDYINVPKFGTSLSKIRASSHDLEIERGRYTRPKTDPKQRLCAWCLGGRRRSTFYHQVSNQCPRTSNFIYKDWIQAPRISEY